MCTKVQNHENMLVYILFIGCLIKITWGGPFNEQRLSGPFNELYSTVCTVHIREILNHGGNW